MQTRTMHTNEFSETLTPVQRKNARDRMAEQFCDLLRHSPSEGLYWQSSKTDLIDLSYEVYLTESLKDGEGHPLGFKWIVKRACDVLHVAMPCNPYSMAFNARNRKGVRQCSFFSRYCWMMFRSQSVNPIRGMVEKIR